MRMESEISIYNDVANYLAEWNPIGVPEGIAECEYSSYVPKIVELLHDKHALESYMQRVIDGIGVFAADVVVPESVIVTRDLVAPVWYGRRKTGEIRKAVPRQAV